MSDFARIQGNVQKMVDQQAPHEDIDGYLQHEGLTPEQFKAQLPAPQNMAATAQAQQPQAPGMLNGAAQFLAKGLTFGGTNEERALNRVGGSTMRQFEDMTPAQQADATGAMENIRQNPQLLQNARNQVQGEQDAFQKAHPVVSTAAEIAGGAASPEGLLLGGALRPAQGARALARIVGSGAQGAATGGAYGFGTDPTHPFSSATKGAVVGGALGAAVPAVTEVAAKVLGTTAQTLANKAPAMTQDQFKAAAQAGYKAAEDAGVYIKPEAFQAFTDALPTELNGYHPKVTPGASNIIAALQDEAAKGPITLSTLDKLRSIASGASITRNDNEARLAGNIASKIDDFVEKLKPTDLAAGEDQAAAAIDSLGNARSLWKTYSKLRTVSDIVETGDVLNDQNWVKGRFRALVKSPQFDRFTPDEQTAIGEVARTGSTEKLLKLIPWRGIQMTTTYAEPLMQQNKIASLQDLIARGGKAAPAALPASARARIFGSAVPALAPGAGVLSRPLMTGASNQNP